MGRHAVTDDPPAERVDRDEERVGRIGADRPPAVRIDVAGPGPRPATSASAASTGVSSSAT